METDKKSDHRVNIVRLGEPRIHTNADTLELFDIGGYQVVTKKGEFKAGDLAVYIQPDSVVPQNETFRFIWEQYATAANTVVPERRRRITCRRLRKEYSEGMIMKLSDFPELPLTVAAPLGQPSIFDGGQDVSDLLGITHYEGDQDVESTESDNGGQPKYRRPRTLKGWFFWALYKLGLKGARQNMNIAMTFHVPSFDVENIKNFKNELQSGEPVIVTEKIHGSQARYVYKDGVMYAGSRNCWKSANSPCVWRKALEQNPWIEEWCRLVEGGILYGEVVPTQKGYFYGCKPGEVRFFLFDVRDVTGEYLEKKRMLLDFKPSSVPILYEGVYDAEKIATLVDGMSAVEDGITPREGIVITATTPGRWARGIGRIQLKWKSNAFLEKEGNDES
jgi:hypothetical protein